MNVLVQLVGLNHGALPRRFMSLIEPRINWEAIESDSQTGSIGSEPLAVHRYDE
jgi:hypothetical protein